MGTVVDKLNYLKDTKTAIKQALIEKGVEVADSDTFRSYAQKVADIIVGGGDIDNLIDKSIMEITSGVTSIGKYAFFGCTNLNNAYFPKATTTGEHSFQSSTNLKSVSFPVATIIDVYAFYACTYLNNAYFPKVTTIKEYAFNSCVYIKSFSFPVATRIEGYTFDNCQSLTTIYIGTESDTVCTLSSKSAFNYCNKLTDIYVPEALVDSYKTATNWSNFADKIKAYTGETA